MSVLSANNDVTASETTQTRASHMPTHNAYHAYTTGDYVCYNILSSYSTRSGIITFICLIVNVVHTKHVHESTFLDLILWFTGLEINLIYSLIQSFSQLFF